MVVRAACSTQLGPAAYTRVATVGMGATCGAASTTGNRGSCRHKQVWVSDE